MVRELIFAIIPVAAFQTSACERGPTTAHQHVSKYDAHHCGGRPRHWQLQGSEFGELALINGVGIKGGKLTWNGTPTTYQELKKNLSEAGARVPQPRTELVIAPGSDCTKVEAVRHLIDTSLNCSPRAACVEYSDEELAKLGPPPPNP